MSGTNNKLYYFFISIIIFFAVLIRITAYFNNIYWISADECHSLAGVDIYGIKEIFTTYFQGLNFLPLYKCILQLMYKINGYNYYLFKLPSLIFSLLSIFIFYFVNNNIFKNRLVKIITLFLFAINYNLICYSGIIKPYEIEVFCTLLLLGGIIQIQKKYNNDIPIKTIILYSLVSIPIIFSFFSSIAIIELYWGIIILQNIILKNFNNIKKLFVFQIITAPFIIFEYFTYISQIQADSNLREQWFSDLFFAKPISFEAINSLINFAHFRFFWFDKDLDVIFPKYIIMLYIIIFILGTITLITPFIKGFFKKQLTTPDFIGLYVTLPVYTFLFLSFINIYPFCNRVIIFLIPLFIIILFKTFDISLNKYNWVLKALAILIWSLFIFHHFKYPFLLNCLFIDSRNNAKTQIEILENAKKDNDLILSTDGNCIACINNKKIFIIDKNSAFEKDIIKYKKLYEYEYTSQKSSKLFKNKKYIYFVYNNADDSEEELNAITHTIQKNGFVSINQFKNSSFVDCIIFEKNK